MFMVEADAESHSYPGYTDEEIGALLRYFKCNIDELEPLLDRFDS